MRIYQQVLLVMVLSIGLIAVGIAWERFCIAPLVEQAFQKPDSADSAADDLPAECLAELSTMGQPSTTLDPPLERPSAAEMFERPTLADGDNTQAGENPNQSTPHIQVTHSSPVQQMDHDAIGQLIHRAQSAEWVEPITQPAANTHSEQASRAGALPASAEELKRQNDLHASLKSVDALDLMRRLRAEDIDQRAEARRELLRRNFSEVDLELAGQLFSPDIETRKQLVRAVPRLSSVDAAQWLMWLALDPQPEVRLAAVTTLATTGDPALLGRVEALARNDRDPQIQAMAEQIAKQRDLSSARGNPAEPAGRVSIH
jgi:hypothetical protein